MNCIEKIKTQNKYKLKNRNVLVLINRVLSIDVGFVANEKQSLEYHNFIQNNCIFIIIISNFSIVYKMYYLNRHYTIEILTLILNFKQIIIF